MSSYSSEEYKVDMDESFQSEMAQYKRIIKLKEELLPNNINYPIFINYYTKLEMEETKKDQAYQEEDNNENWQQLVNSNEKKNFASKLLSDKEYQKLQKEEQIDEIKINLFFILKLKANYNNEYTSIINGISKKYIKSKRLIIQKYDIFKNLIHFEQKQYYYIPIFNSNGDIFNYEDNKSIQIIKKKNEDLQMVISDKQIMNEKDFQKNNKITNLNEEEQKYNKSKSLKKSNKSEKNKSIDMNSINNNNSESISDNKSDNNKPLSQMTPKINDNITKISETSDNEIKGCKFFDEKNRYIYSYYEKEIDGVFSLHNTIKLNKKGKIDLIESLNSLYNGQYDDNNDIKSHIIYKNLEDDKIQENIPFILEVKKSMAELYELLIQAKEISKVVKNLTTIKLPNLFIGIICSFNKNQIKYQQGLLNKVYRNGLEETFLQYIMKIIETNKINVVITVIRDETISGYPLGIEDFFIENENITKRIDINYFNKKICDGEYKNEELEKICKKYAYKSLFYDILDNKLGMLKIQNDNNKLKEEVKKSHQIISENEQVILEKDLQIKQIMEEVKKLITEEEFKNIKGILEGNKNK